MLRKSTWLLLCLPLLSACINDGAALLINGANHSLSLTRQQPQFWDKKVKLHMVVSRMPECQRRHALRSATVATATAELYAPGEGTYILKQGKYLYLFETTTCLGFQEMKEEPPSGLGEKLGAFRMQNGTFRFIPEPVKPPSVQ